MLPALTPLEQIVVAALVVVITFGLFEGISRLVQRFVLRVGGRPASVRGVRDGFRIVWAIVAVSAAVSVTGIASQFTVLTLSGIAGLLVSLALQAVLSNIIAGFLLLRDGALRVGDVIEYGGVKGRVDRVALRNTWLVTDNGAVAIIGNSSLMGGPLVNHTAGPRIAAELQSL